LGKYAGGGRTVLVIDEAQNLTVPLLEELRMLSNLEGESDKLFQIVLAGHPRLLQLLRSPDLETLNQRVGARASLTPLNDEETIAYIQHQLECAGARWDEVVSLEAMNAVYEATSGVPRRINQLCDHALLRAYVTDQRRLDRDLIEESHVELEQPEDQPAARTPMAAYSTPNPASQRDESDEVLSIADSEATICETLDTFVACTESAGLIDSMEISTEQIGSPVYAVDSEDVECTLHEQAAARQQDFVEEEIVMDRYAMMDAARTNRMGATDAGSQPSTTVPAAAIAKTECKAEAPRPHVVPFDEASSTVTAEPWPVDSAIQQPLFVDSGDNPAVLEVGSGLTDESSNATTEPPLLVIENRQQRIGNHIARVDGPQQPGRENRGYRRLFTHARKSDT
jgi:hypothetical protein